MQVSVDSGGCLENCKNSLQIGGRGVMLHSNYPVCSRCGKSVVAFTVEGKTSPHTWYHCPDHPGLKENEIAWVNQQPWLQNGHGGYRGKTERGQTKIIMVESCQACPCRTQRQSFDPISGLIDSFQLCNGFRDRVPRSIVNHDLNEIPKWCPLPDKE